MNKIYKVKKNAAGNSVACSEFAKGHAKKAVLGSLLIIGALGMVTTASAQAQSSSIGTLEEIEKKAQKLAEQAGAGKITDTNVITNLLALGIQGNQISIQDLNTRSDINKDSIAEIKNKITEIKNDIQMNDDYIGDLYEANEENVNRLIEHGDKIWANEESIQYLNKEVQNNIDNIQNLKADTLVNRADVQELKRKQESDIKDVVGMQNAIAEQADKNRNHIQDLAKAQLAGVTVMEELNKNVEENKRNLSIVTGKASKNQIDIQRNNDSIEDLYEANNENVERLIEHGDKIWANEESVQYLNKEVQNNINNIQNLSKASSANTKRISTAELGIAENKKDALITKAQADKNKNDIQDLAKTQLAGVETMKELDKNVQANKADADAKFKGVQTDIANNKTTLAQHTKQINENKQSIEAKLGGKADEQKLAELKTNVDKNQADIADNINNIHKLAQQQDQHGSDIRTLAKAGITNKDAIAKNTQSITTLDSKVNTFDGRISALDAKVNGFDGRINALDDKFKNGMAAQAALNGLFQPYSVGKVSVSAAIGGYGSKSAIAIGAGYRVNPQLAFKGGTAINMGGSKKGSYNIGVNYEF